MNYVDVIMLIILAFLAVYGFLKGLFRGLFAFLGLSVGISVAMNVYDKIFKLHALQIATFAIVFLSLFIAFVLLGKVFQKLFKKAELGIVDKVGGVIFGLFKGVLFACFLSVVLITYYPKTHNTMAKSMFTPKILMAFDHISGSLPKKIKKEYRANYKKYTKLRDKQNI